MTSNLGSDLILAQDDKSTEQLKDQIDALLKTKFRPEFLNRIDEIVMFKRLEQSAIASIVKIQLERIKSRLAERRIQLEFDQSAVDFIARNGFDRDFGARPVKRAVQNYVENPLAKLILAGKFSDECKIKVLAAGDKLDFVET